MSSKIFARRSSLVALIVCIGFAGCAHDGAKEKTNRLDRIKTISISPLVVMPASIHYFSNGPIWGEDYKSIRTKFEDSHVDIGAILVAEARAAFAKQQRFEIVESDPDSVLSFTVKDYGLHATDPFSSDMK